MNKRLEDSIARKLEKLKTLTDKKYIKERDRFVRYCRGYLMSYKRIGDMVGVSKQRVAQILQGK